MEKFKPRESILIRLIITVAFAGIVVSFLISQVVSDYIEKRFGEHLLERTKDVLELCFVACDDAFQDLLSQRKENNRQVVEAVKKDILLRIKNISKTRGDSVHTVVLDPENHVLISSIPLPPKIKLDSPPDGNSRYAKNYKKIRFRNSSNKELIGFARYFPAWKWLLISAVEAEDLAQVSHPAQRIILLGFAVEILIICLAFLFIFSRRIHKPLKELGNAARGLKEGKYEKLHWHREDEIGLIAEAFDRLTEGLEKREKELMEARQAIVASERRFRDVFENANDVIVLLDGDGDIIDVNQKAEDLLGISKAEMIGNNLLEFMPYEFLDAGKALLMQVAAAGKANNFEMGLSKRDGGCVFFEASCKRYRDEKSGEASVICVLRDISDKKKIEREIIATKNLLENIIENAIDALVIVDSEGYVMRVNQKFKDISGYGATQVIGKHYSELLSEETDLKPILRELQEKGLVTEKEISAKISTGEYIPIELSAKRIYDTNRVHHATIVVARDLREKKNLQAQLVRAQKMEAIGTLAGGIAHDFNNLLTAVKGFTQMMMLSTPEDSEEREYLKQIEHAANRASDLTRQLLTFSRRVRSEKQPTELNREIKGVEKLLKRTLPKMITIQTELTEKLTLINADPSQIEQILMNLAVNARDAMPEGGTLTISTDVVYLDHEYCKRHLRLTPGEYVMLCVEDTGVGMDPETRERIFDPFFTTKEVGRGTGLGLAMVYGIVENHDGHIICYSEVGKGTVFKIYFPSYSASQKIPGRKDVVGESDFPRGTETILVIDDEESVRKLSGDLLTNYGYRVLTARDGEEGIRIYQEHQHEIDLIILDFIMPGMGGDKCLKRLIEIDKNAKIIIASGFAMNRALRNLLENGAKGFINKPFSVKDLLQIIRNTLDGKGNGEEVTGTYR